jgi:hypothetical protein
MAQLLVRLMRSAHPWQMDPVISPPALLDKCFRLFFELILIAPSLIALPQLLHSVAGKFCAIIDMILSNKKPAQSSPA